MSRVFRIHNKNANQNITDWQNDGNSYSAANSIDTNILDPVDSNASVSKTITSIPSPFAQIDLVKTAFKVVAKGDPNGNTMYHKLVSNALDIAEIFFNIDKFKNEIEILFWNKTDLNSLTKPEHQLVKHALETYLGDTGYNFDKMNRIFMLNYKGPDRPVTGFNILGGTSPATMFFCSANDLSYASKNICFANGDKPFDNQIQSLLNRDENFFAYMFALAKRTNLFSELRSYVELCDSQSTDQQKELAQEAFNNFDKMFDDILVGQDPVKICDISLKKKKVADMVQQASQCDFVIKSSKQGTNIANPPLVLPVVNGTRYAGWSYSSGQWDTNPTTSNVPVEDPNPLKNRKLPNDKTPYPYLTMNDFLEKKIIRMGGKYNNDYFNGHETKKNEDDFSYLLPLTDTFFEYFTVDDLKNRKVGNKDMIEVRATDSGVFVNLRIPVMHNNGTDYVEYERYYSDVAPTKPEDGEIFPKLDDNGFISDEEVFMLTLMPRVKFLNPSDAHYRVSLLSEKNQGYTINCYSANGLINNNNFSKVVRCNGGNGNYRHEVIAVEGENIAYIRISSANGSGIALPNMKDEQRNGKSFIFAVDFGTSNTHIEFQDAGNRIQSFSVLDNDRQVASLPTSTNKLNLDAFTKRLDFELMPQMTGSDYHFQFPFRTSLCESNLTDWNGKVIAMADVNIPFVYGKRKEYSCNNLRTNLKWINNNLPRERYIESLLFIIRNKVLLNGGDLSQTQIVWSYPLSMSWNAFVSLDQTWQNLFQKYIGKNTANLKSITESVSPYFKHKNLPGTIATIDIGGGTTDILVAKNGTPQCISSFRYAADDLFRDNTQDNKMIEHYSTIIKEYLKNFKELEGVMTSLENRRENRSADLASFFFSLSQNKDVVNKTDALNFNTMLQNDGDYKIIFVVFYGAIIYHMAKLMKEKNLGFPRNIAFSGNGSKIINILSPSDKTLEIFTKRIFEKVFGSDYDSNGLSIKMTDNPKEVTCEGSIEYLNADANIVNPNNLKTVLLPTGICGDDVEWEDLKNSETYSAVNEEIESYLQIIIDLTKGRDSIVELFGINKESVRILENNYTRDLDNYLKNELNNKTGDEIVNEPIFFFPIKGMIESLQAEITNNLKSQN